MTLASRTTSAIVKFVGVDYRVGLLAVNDADRGMDRAPRSHDVRLPLAGCALGRGNNFTPLAVAEICERAHQVIVRCWCGLRGGSCHLKVGSGG